MASIQSHILKFLFKRGVFFGKGKPDLLTMRLQIEQAGRRFKPRRDVRIISVEAGTVAAEWLIPAGAPGDRALLYIHGGAWFMGSTNTHRTFVSHLVHACGTQALLINYRLAPEFPFPAGLDDCMSAYEWLINTGISPNRIVVAGDSAGGNLTLALLVALRDAGKPLPAGAVAISPPTDMAFTGESYKSRAHLDPVISNLSSYNIIQHYMTDHDPRHPYLSPLYADLAGLPPLLIHVGDHEVLLDDAVRIGERAVACGVDATTVVWPHMFHVFPIFTPLLPEARRAVDQISTFTRARLDLPARKVSRL